MNLRKLRISFFHGVKKILLTPERLWYTRIKTPSLVKQIRQKDRISVLFVVFELASWKTESLYNKMLSHPRFSPELLVVPSLENREEIHRVEQYMEKQGYPFHRLKPGASIAKTLHPDIIFYQKPYDWCIDKSLFFRRNLGSLFCYMSYCFRNTTKDFNQNSFFHNYAWQIYVENESVQSEMRSIMDNGARNTIVTGLTVMDDLMKDKCCFPDPWKASGNRKRIIYAPHHTINNEEVNRSTFLVFGEFMLQMAEKYKDQVQWAFKPHPLLRNKLEKKWGKERTEAYYDKWSNLENSQYEQGEYLGLFKYSDAMIHDCGSFILEYLYTQKPVMYLIQDRGLGEEVNEQTRRAFDVHYHGGGFREVESFIEMVIKGEDGMKEVRESFWRTHLVPPGGGNVSDHIIQTILEY